MDKDRLKHLKEKNKLFVRRKKWEENQLLQECIKALDDIERIESEERIQQIISSMQERFSFDAYHQLNIYEMNLIPAMNYYIVWDNAELPIIKCKGKYILKCFDDVFAVSFDTYIIAEDFSECFRSDDIGKVLKYDAAKGIAQNIIYGCELEKISEEVYRYYYGSKQNHSAWVTIKCSEKGEWYYIRLNNVSQSENFSTLQDCIDNAYRDMARAKL